MAPASCCVVPFDKLNAPLRTAWQLGDVPDSLAIGTHCRLGKLENLPKGAGPAARDSYSDFSAFMGWEVERNYQIEKL